MPVGQLDGGHGTFALFGARAHHVIGRVAFVSVVVLALLGFWWHGSPSGFLYAVLLAVMMQSPTSRTRSDGTIGNQTNRDRHHHPDRLRPLLLALPDHD